MDAQLTSLSACLGDEIMGCTGIKQNNRRISVQRKCTREDLLALENILHGGVVDATGLGNDHLMGTTWLMSDVTLCGRLLQCGAVLSEVARATTVEAGVAGGGSSGRWCRQVHHRWRWG
jgi:hypothetical protein